MEIKTNITWKEWMSKYSEIIVNSKELMLGTHICNYIITTFDIRGDRSIAEHFHLTSEKEKWKMYNILNRWKQ